MKFSDMARYLVIGAAVGAAGLSMDLRGSAFWQFALSLDVAFWIVMDRAIRRG
jgi:hypothetical protein